jgi:hypothetical protein
MTLKLLVRNVLMKTAHIYLYLILSAQLLYHILYINYLLHGFGLPAITKYILWCQV